MLPRPLFTEEHNIFRDSVRRFVENEIVPHHDEWEKNGVVSRDAWLKAGQAGLLCCTVPESYGGPGGDFLHSTIVIEELARAGASGPGFSLHTDITTPYIMSYGSEDQKMRWVPRMVTGEVITAIAMTEPETGSDLQAVKTSAVPDGNELLINGQKTFITNGQNADLIIVVAKTEPSQGAHGTSLVLVETDREVKYLLHSLRERKTTHFSYQSSKSHFRWCMMSTDHQNRVGSRNLHFWYHLLVPFLVSSGCLVPSQEPQKSKADLQNHPKLVYAYKFQMSNYYNSKYCLTFQ